MGWCGVADPVVDSEEAIEAKSGVWTAAGEFLDDIVTMKCSSGEHALPRVSQDSQSRCKIMYWRPVLIRRTNGWIQWKQTVASRCSACKTPPPPPPMPESSLLSRSTNDYNVKHTIVKYAIYLQQIRSQVPSCVLYSRQSTNP